MLFIDVLFTKRCLLCAGDLGYGQLCESCRSLCIVSPADSGSFFSYQGSIRDLLTEAKFNRGIGHAHALFDLLKHRLEYSEQLRQLRDFRPDALSYIPSHRFKIIIRGLDLASMFAALLAKSLACPVVPLLRRISPSMALSKTSSKQERKQLVSGAFQEIKHKISFNRLVLVDDIITTGSTFDEAKKTLHIDGNDCRCVAIAKTP